MACERLRQLASSTLPWVLVAVVPIQLGQPHVAFAANDPPIASGGGLQRDFRSEYLRASPSRRVAIAQSIGEDGAARYASDRQLRTLLSPHGRSVPIGPDAVYRNPHTGRVVVVEAKGGTSPLKTTYHSLQGTNLNAVRSAAGMMAARGTVPSERVQLARVIRAAELGRLDTAAVRTGHVMGKPLTPAQIGKVDSRSVRWEAWRTHRQMLRERPDLAPAFAMANSMRRNVSPRRWWGLQTKARAPLIASAVGGKDALATGAARIGMLTGATTWSGPLAIALLGATAGVWLYGEHTESERERERRNSVQTATVEHLEGLYSRRQPIMGSVALGN